MTEFRDESSRQYRRRLRIVLMLIAGVAVINIAWTTLTVSRTDPTVLVAVGGQHLRTDESISNPSTPSISSHDRVSTMPTNTQEQEDDDDDIEPQEGESQETKATNPTTNVPRTTDAPGEDDDPMGPQDEEPTAESDDDTEETESHPDDPTLDDMSTAGEIESDGKEYDDSTMNNEATISTTTVVSDPMGIPPVKQVSEALSVHYTSKQPAELMEAAWAGINGPLIEIRHYSDTASRDLVAQFRPHFVQTYDTQLSPVERADYFRYLVLWAFGGLYIDSDIYFVRSVDQWLNTFGWDPNHDGWRLLETFDLVVGIEFPEAQTAYDKTGWLPFQLAQFVLAGAKNSTILASILDHVESRVETIGRGGNIEWTLQRTGPAAFTRAILNEIESRGLVSPSLSKTHETDGSDTRYPRALLPVHELEQNGQHIPLQRKDNQNTTFDHVLILPYRAFGFHPDHKHAKKAVLARHLFFNSWRQTMGV